MNFIIVKVRNYIYTMVCEDVKQIIYSYTYTGKDPATYELYCDYYDKLYDFITKDFCIHKNYLRGSTIKIIMDLNELKVEHIKKMSRPCVFNYMNFSNQHIKQWFNEISSGNRGFLSHAKDEFSELFYDQTIIDEYFRQIFKIKLLRQELAFDEDGTIIDK